jgi:hypothetical protein
MSRRTFSVEDKVRLVHEWAPARLRGERQESFARRHGTSARRLREFVAEIGLPQSPLETARRIVEDAIEDLQALLARLDRSVTFEPAAEPARRSAEPVMQQPPLSRDRERVDGSTTQNDMPEPGTGTTCSYHWDL